MQSAGLLLVLAVSVLLTWPLGVGALTAWLQSASWQSARCEIVSSTGKATEDRLGKRRDATVEYRYRFQARGQRYEADRGYFGENGWGSMRRAYDPQDPYRVDRLAAGTVTECWFNPQSPREAVLYRRLGSFSWLVLGVLALLMLAATGSLLRRQ